MAKTFEFHTAGDVDLPAAQRIIRSQQYITTLENEEFTIEHLEADVVELDRQIAILQTRQAFLQQLIDAATTALNITIPKK